MSIRGGRYLLSKDPSAELQESESFFREKFRDQLVVSSAHLVGRKWRYEGPPPPTSKTESRKKAGEDDAADETLQASYKDFGVSNKKLQGASATLWKRFGPSTSGDAGPMLLHITPVISTMLTGQQSPAWLEDRLAGMLAVLWGCSLTSRCSRSTSLEDNYAAKLRTLFSVTLSQSPILVQKLFGRTAISETQTTAGSVDLATRRSSIATPKMKNIPDFWTEDAIKYAQVVYLQLWDMDALAGSPLPSPNHSSLQQLNSTFFQDSRKKLQRQNQTKSKNIGYNYLAKTKEDFADASPRMAPNSLGCVFSTMAMHEWFTHRPQWLAVWTHLLALKEKYCAVVDVGRVPIERGLATKDREPAFRRPRKGVRGLNYRGWGYGPTKLPDNDADVWKMGHRPVLGKVQFKVYQVLRHHVSIDKMMLHYALLRSTKKNRMDAHSTSKGQGIGLCYDVYTLIMGFLYGQGATFAKKFMRNFFRKLESHKSDAASTVGK